MDPITWLFTLLRKFVPMQETEFASMKREADDWHQKMLCDPAMILKDGVPEKDSAFKKFYRKYAPIWYVKLGFAVGWLVAVKMIADFMTEEKDEVNKEKIW